MNRVQFIREHTTVASPPLLPELRLHLATEITPLVGEDAVVAGGEWS